MRTWVSFISQSHVAMEIKPKEMGVTFDNWSSKWVKNAPVLNSNEVICHASPSSFFSVAYAMTHAIAQPTRQHPPEVNMWTASAAGATVLVIPCKRLSRKVIEKLAIQLLQRHWISPPVWRQISQGTEASWALFRGVTLTKRKAMTSASLWQMQNQAKAPVPGEALTKEQAATCGLQILFQLPKKSRTLQRKNIQLQVS